MFAKTKQREVEKKRPPPTLMGIGVLGFVLGLCLVAPSASSFGLADEGDRFGDEDDGFGFGGGGFRALELGGPPPMPRGGGLEFGLGGLLSALLSDNHPRPVHFAPMRFRMRGIRPGGDPFEAGRLAAAQAAGRQEARQSPFGQLFGFPPPHGGPGRHGPRRKVYPFPQDCEAEIVGKCTAIVRVCEGGMSQCTLECETDHPPKLAKSVGGHTRVLLRSSACARSCHRATQSSSASWIMPGILPQIFLPSAVLVSHAL